MKKGNIFINIKNYSKIEIQRRTIENYTHLVNIDAKIISVTTWRKSKLKFRLNLITNILTLGILHAYSLFNPKLYLKIYCKQSLPWNSDYFLVEDIYKNFTLCKTIYSKSSKRRYTYSPNNERKLNLPVSFIYNSIEYKYDKNTNSIIPIFFNMSLYKNSTIVNTFFEGISSLEKYKSQVEKYGKNIINLKIKLIFESFITNDLPQCFSVLISGGICIFCKILIFGIILIISSILIIIIKLLYRYIIFINKLGHDYSLDGIVEYLVKRKYMNDKKKGYNIIKNIDLVPGDILYLTEGEILPCDGIILDGECILSESKILGKIGVSIRYALESNNNYFDYEKNKNSIIFHGSEILKIYSKHTSKRIIVLVINTGINTFKANLFSNLLYKTLLKRNKEKIYGYIFPKYYLIYTIILCVGSTILILYKYFKDGKVYPVRNYGFMIVGLSLMPIYFITSCSIKFLGIFNLNKRSKNIQCVDESRLIESGRINRVIFDKTGTLTENKIDISAFIPFYFDNSSFKFFFKIFEKNNIKKICDEHSKYYRNYIINKNFDNEQNMHISFSQDFKNNSNETIYDKNILKDNSNYELSALFLQCLICCTNLAKINNEICGNLIEKELINKMKWDINTVEILSDNDEEENGNINSSETIIDKIHRIGSIFFNNTNNISNNYNYNSLNIISEVFPKNYYKITEGKKILKTKNSKIKIIKDTNQNKIKKLNSFKLIILTRFFNNSDMEISCIVYNFIEDNYRFMTKGPYEKILKNCINISESDVEKILSKALKEGYKVIACATKIIQYNHNERKKKEEYYLKDLIFCGFIFLKHNLKEESKQIFKNISKMKCDIAISTGDEPTNSIGVGLECGLFNEKNIFVFDLDNKGKKPKIIVSSLNNDIKQDDILKDYDKDKKTLESSKSRKIKEENILSKKSTKDNKNKFRSSLEKKEDTNSHSKSNKSKSKLKFKKINFFKRSNTNTINDEPSSNRELIVKKDSLFHNNELSKIEENESIVIEKIDTLRFEEINNSPINNFKNNNNGEENNSFHNGPIILNKFSGSSLLNALEQSPNSLKLYEPNGKELNPIHKNSFRIPKKQNPNQVNDINNSEEYHLDSNTPLRNLSRPTTSRNIRNEIDNVDFFKGNKYRNHKGSKYMKRYLNKRLTNRGTFFLGNLFNYHPNLPKKIFFDYSLDKVHYFIEGSTLCFSGIALRYMYEKRKSKEIKVLLKLMNKFGKIFYSMSSFDKSLLIKINREIFNKKICMVGDGFNDIEAIMSANIGIYMGEKNNLNTLLSHYYIDENELINVEIIIKNGRGYFENDNLLLPVNIVFTSLWVELISFSYFFETEVNNIMLTFLSTSVFILCVSGFSINPNYYINYNYLGSNEKLIKIFNFLRIFGTFIIKISCHLIFYYTYIYNINLELKYNRKVFMSYFFLLIWSQSMTAIFSFNINIFYRKTILSNFIFLMFYTIFFTYIICLLTVNDISLGYSSILSSFYFEFSKDYLDYLDDTHKLTLLYIIIGDLVLSYIFVNILKKIFEKIASNSKEN